SSWRCERLGVSIGLLSRRPKPECAYALDFLAAFGRRELKRVVGKRRIGVRGNLIGLNVPSKTVRVRHFEFARTRRVFLLKPNFPLFGIPTIGVLHDTEVTALPTVNGIGALRCYLRARRPGGHISKHAQQF